MSMSVSNFLLDTLLWTGGLIALVLIVRRPVARHFGPQAAYALWALPLVRLVLPPLQLPAWFNPETEAAAPVATAAETFVMVQPAPAMANAATVPAMPVDLLTPLLVIWLTGAILFLLRRFALYHRMRGQLLAGARPVGEAGAVRLLESAMVLGPVAFGLRDKVVILPQGFMVSADRQARDLALAHELEHHAGRDLLINILVQPLFALHWFNPLGWIGWRALRRDQEAACDARVVASRSASERAAYASVIAEFARRTQAFPHAALAAPMACPVLGDKSIIQRLRSLTMSEISPRRRVTSRFALAAALVALPLTASITYAETTQDTPDLPTAQDGQAPQKTEREITIVEREVVDAEQAAAKAEQEAALAEQEAEWAELEADKMAEGDRHVIVRRIREPGKPDRIERRVIRHGDSEMTEAERAKMHAEIERDMAELRKEIGESGQMHREIRIAMAEARDAAPKVVVSCKYDREPVTSVEENGKITLFVCEGAGERLALDSIRKARAEIATDTGMPADVRAEVLRSLDAEIANLSK